MRTLFWRHTAKGEHVTYCGRFLLFTFGRYCRWILIDYLSGARIWCETYREGRDTAQKIIKDEYGDAQGGAEVDVDTFDPERN